MHDHETCEQLMAAAQRHPGSEGWLAYLAERCDRAHGELLETTTHPAAAREALATTTTEERA